MLKQLSLKEVEERLNKKLAKNNVVIAFDSSQHSTGISILRTTDKSLIIENVYKFNISKKIHTLDSIDIFIEQLDNLKNSLLGKYKFDHSVIEDAFTGINPQVGIYLARIGILAYDRFRGLSKKAYLRFPTTARKILGFKKSDKKVRGKELKKELVRFVNNLLELEIKDNDIADSLILGLSALVIGEENG